MVSRWHGVLSKKPLLARLAKLFTVQGDFALSSSRPRLPWLVSMLALTVAGSVGTLPARGGSTGLLAGSGDLAYWQLLPRPAGAANGGSAPGLPGSGASSGEAASEVDAAVGVDAVGVPLSRLVSTMVAMTAAITTTAATADPMIVYVRRLRSLSARRSSWRSSLRLAVARRCSFVGTGRSSSGSVRSAPSVPGLAEMAAVTPRELRCELGMGSWTTC